MACIFGLRIVINATSSDASPSKVNVIRLLVPSNEEQVDQKEIPSP